MKIDAHIFFELSKDVQKICSPLAKLNITYFSYIRNFNDGKQIYLANNQDWVKYYYEHELFRSSLFEGHPDCYQSGYVLWPKNNPRPVFSDARDIFDSGDGITFVEKQRTYCDFYFFSGAVGNQSLTNTLINNLDLLQRFILYFQDSTRKTIDLADKHKLSIPEHFKHMPLDDCDLMHLDYVLNRTQILRGDFIRSTVIKKINIKCLPYGIVTLSPKEISCALALLQGKNAQETAEKLSVSKRTVETHLENLKLKLNCYKKSQLVEILLASELKNLIDCDSTSF